MKRTPKRNEDGLRELWNNMKCKNICIREIPEGEEREQGLQKLFEEIMRENLPNLVKENVHKFQTHRKSQSG